MERAGGESQHPRDRLSLRQVRAAWLAYSVVASELRRSLVGATTSCRVAVQVLKVQERVFPTVGSLVSAAAYDSSGLSKLASYWSSSMALACSVATRGFAQSSMTATSSVRLAPGLCS